MERNDSKFYVERGNIFRMKECELLNRKADGMPAIAKNFNEVQDKICPLQPIKMPPNKSITKKSHALPPSKGVPMGKGVPSGKGVPLGKGILLPPKESPWEKESLRDGIGTR